MSQPFSARELLSPLTPAYRLALWLRAMGLKSGLEPTRRLRFPVVSIGNLSTGGTGKTPLTIAIARALERGGFQVDVLSRGYGREGRAACRVDREGTAEQFGDEPLLIAREAGVPVYVGRQRYEAGLVAEAEIGAVTQRPVVHLLDDGFQHRQLARDVDILLLDRRDWQDGLLPSGNLREPLRAARRASILAIPADDPELEKELRRGGWDGTVWHLRRRMEVPAIEGRVMAFCGIARPEQFFAGLGAAGVDLAASRAFPDHHRYTAVDVKRLVEAARVAGAKTLLTTEKDRVRMGALSSSFGDVVPMRAVSLRVELDREDEAMAALTARLRLGSGDAAL